MAEHSDRSSRCTDGTQVLAFPIWIEEFSFATFIVWPPRAYSKTVGKLFKTPQKYLYSVEYQLMVISVKVELKTFQVISFQFSNKRKGNPFQRGD